MEVTYGARRPEGRDPSVRESWEEQTKKMIEGAYDDIRSARPETAEDDINKFKNELGEPSQWTEDKVNEIYPRILFLLFPEAMREAFEKIRSRRPDTAEAEITKIMDEFGYNPSQWTEDQVGEIYSKVLPLLINDEIQSIIDKLKSYKSMPEILDLKKTFGLEEDEEIAALYDAQIQDFKNKLNQTLQM
jgi:hypothetical protein